MDIHAQIIAGHMAIGEAVSRLDQEETRAWMSRNRGGLYIAPELPSEAVAYIACAVALEVIAASLEGRP
jgi:hypothetical protein